MPSFLTTLLILASSFILGGKPTDVQVYIPPNSSLKGFETANTNIVVSEPSIFPTPEILEKSHESDNEKNINPSPTRVPQLLPNVERQMGGLVLPPDQKITPIAGSVQSSGSSVGAGVLMDTSNQTIDDNQHDLSLGIYDEPGFSDGAPPPGNIENEPEESVPEPGDYKPLEIHGPDGIITVSE